jgi:chromosome segregation ATPase
MGKELYRNVCQSVQQVYPYDLAAHPDQIDCQTAMLSDSNHGEDTKEAEIAIEQQVLALIASLATVEARAEAAESAASSRQAEVDLLQSTLLQLRKEVGRLRSAMDSVRRQKEEEMSAYPQLVSYLQHLG